MMGSAARTTAALRVADWSMTFPFDLRVGDDTLTVVRVFRWRDASHCQFAGRYRQQPISVLAFTGAQPDKALSAHLSAQKVMQMLPPLNVIATTDASLCIYPAQHDEYPDFSAALPGDVESHRRAQPVCESLASIFARLHDASVSMPMVESLRVIDDGAGLSPLVPLAMATPDYQFDAELARLASMFPVWADEQFGEVVKYYQHGCARMVDQGALAALRDRYRRERFAVRMNDVDGNSELCKQVSSSRQYAIVTRDLFDQLKPLIDAPDAVLESGEVLKRGTANTVMKVTLAGQVYTLKRYNLKSWRVVLRRLWKRSRPWQAWRATQGYVFHGIPTPRPHALVREKFGPFYLRAWILTDYVAGPVLGDVVAPWRDSAEPEAAVAQPLTALLRRMHTAQVSHGDTKHTNILWSAKGPCLIDMDAARCHTSASGFARAWQVDCERLLRNWPEASAFRAWLESTLASLNGGGADAS